MLLDCATMSPSVIAWTGCECESFTVYPPTCIHHGTWKTSRTPTDPLSSAAAAVTTLFTDPGSNMSVTARFRTASRFACSKSFGSNHG